MLVLNNDVEVDPGFLRALLDEAGRRPEAGALSPLDPLRRSERPDLVRGRELRPAEGLQRPAARLRRARGGRFDEVVETDRICGAAMLVPRPVLEEVGVFDPELFSYYEDTDWSLRARAAGHRLYVVPAEQLWHKVSRTSGGESSPTTLYYGTRNALAVCERHAPLGLVGTWRRRLVLLSAHLVQAASRAGSARGSRRVAGLAGLPRRAPRASRVEWPA